MLVTPILFVLFNLFSDDLLGCLLFLVPFRRPDIWNIILVQEFTSFRVDLPLVELARLLFRSIHSGVVTLMHLPSSVFTAILEGNVMLLVAHADSLTINYRNFGTLTQHKGWNHGLPEDDDRRCFWVRVAVHFGQHGELFSGDTVVEMRVIQSSPGGVLGLLRCRWEVPLEFVLHLELDLVGEQFLA